MSDNLCDIEDTIFNDKFEDDFKTNVHKDVDKDGALYINYNLLHSMCEQYLRLINKNKVYMHSFYSTMTQLIQRAQNKLPTDVIFSTSISSNNKQNEHSCLVGTLAPPNQRSRKRFKGAYERTYQQANKSNDSDFVTSKPRKKLYILSFTRP